MSLDKKIHSYRSSFLSKSSKKKILTDTMVAVIAEEPKHNTYASGHSGCWKECLYINTPSLKSKLEGISKTKQIGGISKFSTCNIVGNCAEDMAACRLLIKTNNHLPIHRIHFSRAVRIQTFETIKPCINCKNVFPTL